VKLQIEFVLFFVMEDITLELGQYIPTVHLDQDGQPLTDFSQYFRKPCPDSCPIQGCDKVEPHDFRKCPLFIACKTLTSADSYITETRQVKEVDHAGFCAAGLLPFALDNETYRFLLHQEVRKGVRAWSMFAGKREAREPSVRAGGLETPAETALREFAEEAKIADMTVDDIDLIKLEFKRQHDSCAKVWLSSGKMVLFLFEVNANIRMIGEGKENVGFIEPTATPLLKAIMKKNK
jgi:8-oxo-dGTP pyrophosphatase MutT (NUDIX family)